MHCFVRVWVTQNSGADVWGGRGGGVGGFKIIIYHYQWRLLISAMNNIKKGPEKKKKGGGSATEINVASGFYKGTCKDTTWSKWVYILKEQLRHSSLDEKLDLLWSAAIYFHMYTDKILQPCIRDVLANRELFDHKIDIVWYILLWASTSWYSVVNICLCSVNI